MPFSKLSAIEMQPLSEEPCKKKAQQVVFCSLSYVRSLLHSPAVYLVYSFKEMSSKNANVEKKRNLMR